MVDCDHSTGENAKAKAPPTPPPNASRELAVGSWQLVAVESSPDMKSWAERQISIAVQPAANAPKTAEQSETHHAGGGWPM